MTATSAVWQWKAVTGTPVQLDATESESVGLYVDRLGDIRLPRYWWEQQKSWSYANQSRLSR